jgi:hypothetical protein
MKNGRHTPRIIRPEEEDRRTPPKDRDEKRKARQAGVESLPDGERAAAEEAKKARDD